MYRRWNHGKNYEKKTVFVVCGLLLMSSAAWAVEYTKMSTHELSNLCGTLLGTSQEHRIALAADNPLFFLP